MKKRNTIWFLLLLPYACFIITNIIFRKYMKWRLKKKAIIAWIFMWFNTLTAVFFFSILPKAITSIFNNPIIGLLSINVLTLPCTIFLVKQYHKEIDKRENQ